MQCVDENNHRHEDKFKPLQVMMLNLAKLIDNFEIEYQAKLSKANQSFLQNQAIEGWFKDCAKEYRNLAYRCNRIANHIDKTLAQIQEAIKLRQRDKIIHANKQKIKEIMHEIIKRNDLNFLRDKME